MITNIRVDLRFKLYLWPGAVHQHSPAPTSEVGVVDPAAPGSVVLAAPARRQAPAGEGEAPKGLFINDVSFFIDLHSIEYTLFYSVQVYKKADVIYEQPLTLYKISTTSSSIFCICSPVIHFSCDRLN